MVIVSLIKQYHLKIFHYAQTLGIKDLKALSENQGTKAIGLNRESVVTDGRSEQPLFSTSLLGIRICATIFLSCLKINSSLAPMLMKLNIYKDP